VKNSVILLPNFHVWFQEVSGISIETFIETFTVSESFDESFNENFTDFLTPHVKIRQDDISKSRQWYIENLGIV